MIEIGDLLYHWPLRFGGKVFITGAGMVNIRTGIPWIYYMQALGSKKGRTVTRNYIAASLESGRLILN